MNLWRLPKSHQWINLDAIVSIDADSETITEELLWKWVYDKIPNVEDRLPNQTYRSASSTRDGFKAIHDLLTEEELSRLQDYVNNLPITRIVILFSSKYTQELKGEDARQFFRHFLAEDPRNDLHGENFDE